MTYNFLLVLKYILIQKDIEQNFNKTYELSSYSGYHDADIEEQKALIYFIKSIL